MFSSTSGEKRTTNPFRLVEEDVFIVVVVVIVVATVDIDVVVVTISLGVSVVGPVLIELMAVLAEAFILERRSLASGESSFPLSGLELFTQRRRWMSVRSAAGPSGGRSGLR